MLEHISAMTSGDLCTFKQFRQKKYARIYIQLYSLYLLIIAQAQIAGPQLLLERITTYWPAGYNASAS